MRDSKDLYTSREEVELLLKQTLEGQVKRKKKKPSAFRTVRRVLYLLIVAALLFALGKIWLARINGGVPNLLGYQIYVVETGSMEPTLPVGSTILVRALHADDTLKVGDVITYTHETDTVTHRITELVTGDDGVLRYQTQGDNPDNSADPWLVERENIHGVMIWHFAW
jgi:signal peptidase I